ncbi:hypothetical protein EG856_01470 [Mycoplasmopsis phocirhinis]|uniref:DNA helicase n=1 Tax=Mycoplasmopsis phocirhinis TaxID=142650 RepID=A0A4P6MRY1_9BACT|nr:ATP-binding protein [Mycoplasmopsis phocirhinis]QBF34591.1 hypothetical protein EG856_01470 [Mycoplasmopsis phocirhinis]
MQQVAVNLALDSDDTNIKSVNGPPGTGKTTLLKDIFAELVVKQALEICKLGNKHIDEKIDLEIQNYKIAKVPEQIANKGIVVASSNNAAVQNIVKELPRIHEIDNQNQIPKYKHKTLKDLIIEADYFYNISNSQLQQTSKNENWGLFAIEGGKQQNTELMMSIIDKVFDCFQEYEPDARIYTQFIQEYNNVKRFKNDIQNYSNKLKNIEQDKVKIVNNSSFQKVKYAQISDNDFEKIQLTLQQQISNIEQNINNLIDKKTQIKQNIDSLNIQKPNGLIRLFKRKLFKDLEQQEQEYAIELLKIDKEIKNENELVKNYKKELNKFVQILNKKESIVNLLKTKGIKNLDFTENYNHFHRGNPWFNQEYRILQSNLFILALKVRKQFLYENRFSIKSAKTIWTNQNKIFTKKRSELITQAWNWINLIFPVISSTFASFSRMFQNLAKESIGYLFIDEAGQALPQASVGAIFRSKRLLVVGDPSQIEPVLTLDLKILHSIAQSFDVYNDYFSSTQYLVDQHSEYGYQKADKSWIGIPLWVQRRWLSPMFDISNAISYDDKMVQGKNDNTTGVGEWIDVESKNADDKYVKEQANELINQIIKIQDTDPNKSIYVISPFKNVANRLIKDLDEIGFVQYSNNNKAINVGTVHTFQGKEADVVFLVLGCDDKNTGAANWAVKNPNLMNVAATRARKEFYIIGDKKIFENLGSEVIKKTLTKLTSKS